MLTRRAFGASVSAAAAPFLAPWLRGGSASGDAIARDRIAAQVYVFTQHFSRRNEKLRDHIAELLQDHRDAGIRNLELMADLLDPEPLRALRAGGEEFGIRFPVIYSGARLYEHGRHAGETERLRVLARQARSLGARFLNCNPDPKPQKAAKPDAELRAEADGINAIGRAVREEGLRLLLHNHDAEMRDGARNWRFWLEETDPALAGFCLDTHWIYRGGQDVLALLKVCRPRLEALHLRNSRRKIWWQDLDDGDLDYRPIAAHLRETGYAGLLTIELAWDRETALTRSLAENLRRSRIYTARRFL